MSLDRIVNQARPQNSTFPVAAIQHRRGEDADLVMLRKVVDSWSARGLVVRGLVDDLGPTGLSACGIIKDLETKQRYRIFQDLGPGAIGCRIDPSGVAAASVALRRAIETRADLVVANRFGKLESAGGGLAHDMLAVMEAGLPLLAFVSEPWLEQWRAFTGGVGEVLEPERNSIDAWIRRNVMRAQDAMGE